MLALMLSLNVSANEELRQYVDENTQRLVQQLNEEQGLFESDPEAFYKRMDQAMTDFVDFRRIAARVMGRYARQTSPEQRDEFVERFKRSLFESYAQALVGSADDFEINVKSASVNPNNDDRGSVDMEVTSDSGNRYQISYSMYRNSDGVWLMENVIVEGVNLGLAFRDRFAQEMESRRGDVDEVISNWGDAVASLNLDDEMDN
ncbi:ABC transporter substrate-binding protein [uncultured Marinobacter sp.]|uniref:MlaC/ttg2D family ABC transporter substrate-binding protein n=1 Tax=uncultured Marinobacter sp. TaxID=187379 RepID=UPI0030DAF51A